MRPSSKTGPWSEARPKARVLSTLAKVLLERRERWGLAAICIGVGRPGTGRRPRERRLARHLASALPSLAGVGEPDLGQRPLLELLASPSRHQGIQAVTLLAVRHQPCGAALQAGQGLPREDLLLRGGPLRPISTDEGDRPMHER